MHMCTHTHTHIHIYIIKSMLEKTEQKVLVKVQTGERVTCIS